MHKYLLPNGLKIDFDRIVEAVLSEEEYPQVFLDTENATLVEVFSAESLHRWVDENEERSQHHFLVERFGDRVRDQIARDFIDIIMTSMASKKEAEGSRLALVRGGWRKMEEFLEEKTDGWIHSWDQFVHDEASEQAHRWLTENPHVEIKAVFEGCENCAICELMRRSGDGDSEELLKAFETQNIMNSFAEQMKNITKSAKAGNKKVAVKKNKANVLRESKNPKTKKTLQAQDKNKKSEVPDDKVLSFKVTLNDSKPKVWRRIIVPADYTFFELHLAIQDAMGWTDSHLHHFMSDTRSQPKSKRKGERGEVIYINFPNPEIDDWDVSGESIDERFEKIADWFPKRVKQCTYEYDFGDSWSHTVLFERELGREKGQKYPQCTAGKNACPPEDCGGVWGYKDLQKILKNTKHPEHESMLEWLMLEDARDFDPSYFDPSEIEFADPKDVLKEYEKGFGLI